MDIEHIKAADSASVDQSVQDARDLATMGHDQALTRKFDLWSMLALAFCVLGTYSTFAQGLSSGLTNGGPITILWGLVLVTVCNLCVAVSLGELTSSMPTALGQAYWVYRLWHTPTGRFVSYLCAWINTFGWWTLTASQIAFMTEFLLGMKVMFDETWGGAGVGWLQFVIYLGLVLVLTGVNVVGCRREKILPWLNGFVGVWFTGLFVVLSLALLISVGTKADLSFQPGRFVFGAWMNQTGWSDGVVWFTGLVQAAYGLTAFDAVIHMVEEMPAPRINAPRVTYLAVLSGAVTGFVFMVVCLFCMQDVDRIVDSPSGLPFIELMLETVGLKGGRCSDRAVHLQWSRPGHQYPDDCIPADLGVCPRRRSPLESVPDSGGSRVEGSGPRALGAGGLDCARWGALPLCQHGPRGDPQRQHHRLDHLLRAAHCGTATCGPGPAAAWSFSSRPLGNGSQLGQHCILCHHDGLLLLPGLARPSPRGHELRDCGVWGDARRGGRVLVPPGQSDVPPDGGCDRAADPRARTGVGTGAAQKKV